MEYKVGDKVYIKESLRSCWQSPFSELDVVTISEINYDIFCFYIEELRDTEYSWVDYDFLCIDNEKTLELGILDYIRKHINALDLKPCMDKPIEEYYDREILAESLSSDNFKVDIWHTDNTYSIGYYDTGKDEIPVEIIDSLNKEEVMEIIELLKESLKL